MMKPFVKVNGAMIGRELKILGFTYKKTLYASEQERENVIQKRQERQVRQSSFNPEKTVFLDEFGTNTKMIRLYGYSEKGKRLMGKVPHGHWISATGICAIRCSGMITAKSFVGGMNNAKFIDFIRDDLCPRLKWGDVVAMDNLQQHKQPEVERLIKRRRCRVLYLPPYSPDFNPIELSFSKVKSILRKRCIRDVKKLLLFIKNIPKLITPDDCVGYYKHCGYGL